MPKVYLTAKEKRKAAEERAIENVYQKIADGLAVLKNRECMTNQQLGEKLGIDRKTVPQLLRMDPIQIDIRVFIKAVLAAGLEVS